MVCALCVGLREGPSTISIRCAAAREPVSQAHRPAAPGLHYGAVTLIRPQHFQRNTLPVSHSIATRSLLPTSLGIWIVDRDFRISIYVTCTRRARMKSFTTALIICWCIVILVRALNNLDFLVAHEEHLPASKHRRSQTKCSVHSLKSEAD